MITGANLSTDRLYRYRLWREWGAVSNRIAFIGVNPSTADETTDDRTITKCIGFAKRWGFGALDMINLFAWRSTDVRALMATVDPIGPDNDATIAHVVSIAARVVLAWGRGDKCALLPSRAAAVSVLVAKRASGDVGQLGKPCADGQPSHPLMLAYATPFLPMPRSEGGQE